MKKTMTINQFGDLLHDVLWVKKSKNKKLIKELENLNNCTSQLGMYKMELELSRNERILDREAFSKTLQKKSWEHIFWRLFR